MKDGRKNKKQLTEELEELRSQLALERAGNRIREQALVMRASDDLRQVVVTMLQEMIGLGVQSPQCSFLFVDEEAGLVRGYNAMKHPRQYGVSWLPPNAKEMAGDMVVGSRAEPLSLYPADFIEAWHAGTSVSAHTEHTEDSSFVQELRTECPDVVRIPSFSGGWTVTNVPFSHGMVGYREREYAEEHVAVVRALAEALSVGYVRFLDFQKIDEAQRQLLEELEHELQTAHDMQMGLMPKESPRVAGLQIASRCLPATQIGGDFFQYFHQGDRLSISTADVTDHGMEAAIPVVVFDGVLDSQVEIAGELEDLFSRLNERMVSRMPGRTHVCFSIGDCLPAGVRRSQAPDRPGDSGCASPRQ